MVDLINLGIGDTVGGGAEFRSSQESLWHTPKSVAAGRGEVSENKASVADRILSGAASVVGALSTTEAEDVNILLLQNELGGERSATLGSTRLGEQQTRELLEMVSRLGESEIGRVPSSNAGTARA